eukprot:CAMPEP_0171568826 /NCGR_PEP_ID=MMETSP0961-20121227/1995_1 /TAXON_ID=87120 /ORGANISM="Aurantiochytrium limacinum, Strain ATCCMYA-1381" /LENGTH=247 /DNA_ID=CAMNT_0012123029 /DNA_START=89 /DNA_END=829 /DNA_ORIENTATION=-
MEDRYRNPQRMPLVWNPRPGRPLLFEFWLAGTRSRCLQWSVLLSEASKFTEGGVKAAAAWNRRLRVQPGLGGIASLRRAARSWTRLARDHRRIPLAEFRFGNNSALAKSSSRSPARSTGPPSNRSRRASRLKEPGAVFIQIVQFDPTLGRAAAARFWRSSSLYQPVDSTTSKPSKLCSGSTASGRQIEAEAVGSSLSQGLLSLAFAARQAHCAIHSFDIPRRPSTSLGCPPQDSSSSAGRRASTLAH